MIPRVVGRYRVYEAFAAGGMASVHLGRVTGAAGFARTVAIKQLHAGVGGDGAAVSTLLDEARLASRVTHPSVVSTLDVVVDGADLLLVLEYVHGESLAHLLAAAASPPPIAIVTAIVSAAAQGLHAAHEATAENGEPLGIVHRDVSPHNILVGIDGLARVLDFGVAKARGRLQTTREGQVKGKLAYMAPEQIRGEATRRTDVFAAGVVAWEALTGRRLFQGENELQLIGQLLDGPIPAPSSLRPEVDAALDAVVMRALERDPERRFATARELALALERCGVATLSTVGQWVSETAREPLARRAARLAAIESPSTAAASEKAAVTEAAANLTPASPDDRTLTATLDTATPGSAPQGGHAAPDTPSVRSSRPSRRWLGVAAIGALAAGALGLWAAPRMHIAPAAPDGIEAASADSTGPRAPSSPPSTSAAASEASEVSPPAAPASAEPAASASQPPAPPTPTGRGAHGAALRPPPAASRSLPASSSRTPPAPTGSADKNPFYRFE